MRSVATGERVPWVFNSALLLLLKFYQPSDAVEDPEENEEEEDEENNDYLYKSDDTSPIIEFIPDNEQYPERPDFIYSTEKGPRVVEFYAPWCPHCQHFRSHYVQFAQQVNTVTEELGAESIEFHAISCTANRQVCKDFGITGYPRLHAFPSGSVGRNQSIELKYWEVHPFSLLNSLGIEVSELRLNAFQPHTSSKTLPASPASVDDEYARTKEEVFEDAFRSFDYSLRTGVYMNRGPLTNQTKNALHEWLALLQKALPPVWKIQKVISAILSDFQRATGSEEQLIGILEHTPRPASNKWSKSCTKGVPGMGFSCGLWDLFHIMSVGVVEWNMMLNDDQLDLIIGTDHAAEILRNFIYHFFGCEVCRTNFLAAYDSCSLDRCNRLHSDLIGLEHWLLFPVWLHETHNAVNVRLLKEQGERNHRVPTQQELIQKEWPSRSSCKMCWAEDGSQEMAVYKFLRLEYWPEDFVSQEYRDDLGLTDSQEGNANTIIRFLIVPTVLFGAALLVWYKRKQKLIRTGRHKKIDS